MKNIIISKTVFCVGILCLAGLFWMSFWPNHDVDEEPNMPKEVKFSYHIQPILSKNCYTCHGNDPSSRKAGLRLDEEQSAKSKLESGHTAVVAKRLNRSELVKRILSDDPDIQMPPPDAKKSLTKREIALLKKWIKQGAVWEDHWAFIKPQIGKLNSSNIPETIDNYISEGHESKGLSPADEAAKHQLIRRVSYTLTGLPPSLEELDDFMQDEDDSAYEKMLDRYLSSSHFGERWARHWMDLVRYGETMGHEMDFEISSAYEYRDYLIRAFNQDVSYDQFIKEHLAGDMIEAPRLHPTQGFNESQIGTAYFFLGEGKHSPVDIKLEESEKIDNMIDVTSKTFSALTVACAKCHDHKFDAIPTTDYYAMYGMIESSRLIPKASRSLGNEEEIILELEELRSEVQEEIEDFIRQQNLPIDLKSDFNQTEKIDILENKEAIVLADFSGENWDNWYTDGIAFGDKPVQNHISIETKNKHYQSYQNYETHRLNTVLQNVDGTTASDDKNNLETQIDVLSGFATSRSLAKGLQGVLHGPNFSNDFDTIAIRARGRNGTLRIVLDNFQVIQNPLWGGCETVVDDEEWKTYKLSAQLAKGNKAYLQFFPGTYARHVYSITPDDYVDIQWAIGYTSDSPIVDEILTFDNEAKSSISDKLDDINGVLKESKIDIAENTLQRISQLQESLFDPGHFIGMEEAEAVHSPVFNRGSIKDLSEEKVPHQFLSAVDLPVTFPQTGSGRLAWAEALVHPDNPLTSRVMMNRIWHHLFGKGIVETVDNFGIQGQIPSHPELLDYLAISFIHKNWSIKTMIKEIMMSKTFRMSTQEIAENKEQDPNNIYLHAYPVRRLEAEAIRDGILAVSTCLDTQMYGRSVPVYLSNFMTGRGRPSLSGPIDSYGRRSIYQSVRRNFIPEMMITFDMPIPFTTFGKRNVTNVPAQSLTLLNDDFVHEQAYYWAEDLIRTTKSATERIQKIYSSAFSRMPTDFEVEQARTFLTSISEQSNSDVDDELDNKELWAAYCHSIINAKEFIHLI